MNSRVRGNSSSHHPNAREKHSVIPKNTPSFPKTLPKTSFPKTLRHSREGGNPQFPRTREFNVPLLQCPEKNTPSFPKTLRHSQKHSIIPKNTPSFLKTLHHSQKHSVIPAKAGIHTPSFPRRRESIPAHAGIQRPTTPMP